VVQARENSETMTARATASPGNDGGLSAPGASAKAAPAGREPYGRGEPTPGGCPRFPWAGGGPPLRADRHRLHA
jgi:hypothetical protein